MKALISPNEVYNFTWISAWELVGATYTPIYSEITNCTRIAQVEPDNKIFEVAQPLYWADCSNECNADDYYFKGNQIFIKPQDVPVPSTPVQEMP